tara:strand:- start:100 stop:384 length:285 start_codon:yes stop_codon:yes gene_type:complete
MNLIGRQNSKNFFSLSSSFAFDFLREVKQKKGRSSSKILPLFSALLRALFKQRERERERAAHFWKNHHVFRTTKEERRTFGGLGRVRSTTEIFI